MDHEQICDCMFRPRCETFNDPLIEAARKGPGGFGCRGQNDEHRRRHCKTFRCAYLAMVFTDALKRPLRSAQE